MHRAPPHKHPQMGRQIVVLPPPQPIPPTSVVQVTGRVVCRTVFVIFIWFVALIVPFFGDIMRLLGGCTMNACVLILPLAIYLKLHYRDIAPHRRFGIATLMFFGACISVTATLSTAKEMWSKAQQRQPLQPKATVSASVKQAVIARQDGD